MADNDLYWQQIGSKQDAATARARESSPVTVQVPATGQELVLERSFHQASAHARVTITMIPTSAVGQADAFAWLLAFAFVLFFRLAVRRMHSSVEILTVVVFLITTVILELLSTALAASFLKGGLVGVLAVGAWTVLRRLIRLIWA